MTTNRGKLEASVRHTLLPLQMVEQQNVRGVRTVLIRSSRNHTFPRVSEQRFLILRLS